MTNYDPLTQSNLESIDQQTYQQPQFKQPQEPAPKQSTTTNIPNPRPTSIRTPSTRKPKVIKTSIHKPGGRHNTTMAQRNASRRNIKIAYQAKKFRNLS